MKFIGTYNMAAALSAVLVLVLLSASVRTTASPARKTEVMLTQPDGTSPLWNLRNSAPPAL